jgi:hypothetical protein
MSGIQPTAAKNGEIRGASALQRRDIASEFSQLEIMILCSGQ